MGVKFLMVLFLLTSVLGLSPLVGRCAEPREITVIIEDMKFSPPEIHVAQGESVTWMNKDLVPHTVTADDKSFDSQMIAPGKSWTWRAKKSGKLPFKCSFHPTMFGTLIVD
jgi:plastocyanin